MIKWQDKQLSILSNCIFNEIEYWLNKVASENVKLYGVSLILDDDALTVYMAVGSELSGDAQGKWSADEWMMALIDDSILAKEGMGHFNQLAMQHYNEQVEPLFADDFDYEEERQRNIAMYTQALKNVKKQLVSHYGHELESLLLFLTIPGDVGLAINSAKSINRSSQALDEFIAFNTF